MSHGGHETASTPREAVLAERVAEGISSGIIAAFFWFLRMFHEESTQLHPQASGAH